jgi:hypothetical protein
MLYSPGFIRHFAQFAKDSNALRNRAPRAARVRRHARAQRRRAAVRAGARSAMPCWPAIAHLGGRIRVHARLSPFRESARTRAGGAARAAAADLAARPTLPLGAKARPRE